MGLTVFTSVLLVIVAWLILADKSLECAMRHSSSPHHEDTNRECLKKVPWCPLVSLALSLPLFGLSFCVIYSIIYDFEEVNATHCKVIYIAIFLTILAYDNDI